MNRNSYNEDLMIEIVRLLLNVGAVLALITIIVMVVSNLICRKKQDEKTAR